LLHRHQQLQGWEPLCASHPYRPRQWRRCLNLGKTTRWENDTELPIEHDATALTSELIKAYPLENSLVLTNQRLAKLKKNTYH
jgi:hypothetical protein